MSNAKGPKNAARIRRTPVLQVENQADDAVARLAQSDDPRAALATADKEYVRIEGATHYYQNQPDQLQRCIDASLGLEPPQATARGLTLGPGRLSDNSGRPPPLVLEHDIAQRDAPGGTEPAHRLADRQQRIGVHVGRQAVRCLRFLLVRQIS